MEVWIAILFVILNGQPAFWKNDHQFPTEKGCKAALDSYMKQLETKGIPQYAGTCINVRIGTFV